MLMAQHTVFMAIFPLPPANIWHLAPSRLPVVLSLPGRSMCKGRRLAMQHERQQLQGTSASLIQKCCLQMRVESSACRRWMTQPWNACPPSTGPGFQVCTTLRWIKQGPCPVICVRMPLCTFMCPFLVHECYRGRVAHHTWQG